MSIYVVFFRGIFMNRYYLYFISFFIMVIQASEPKLTRMSFGKVPIGSLETSRPLGTVFQDSNNDAPKKILTSVSSSKLPFQIPKHFADKMYQSSYTNKQAWGSILKPRVTFLDNKVSHSFTAREQTLRLQKRANDRREFATFIQEENEIRTLLELHEQENFFKIQQAAINEQLDFIAAKYGRGLPANQLRPIQEAELKEIYDLLKQHDFNFQAIVRDNIYRTEDMQKRAMKMYVLQNCQKLSRRYFLDDLVAKLVDRYQEKLKQ